MELKGHIAILKKNLYCVQIKLFVLESNTWNYLTVCEQMSTALL